MSEFAPIAIVGRACLLPGASSPEELWQAVVTGADLASSAPADRWGVAPADVMCDGPDDSVDRTWSDRGGYVRGFDAVFDPTGFALAPDEIVALDPVFRWTFHTAREALRDAGRTDGRRTGAVFGNLSFPSVGMADFARDVWLAALPNHVSHVDADHARNRFTSGLPALLLERAIGLDAGAFALDAACASSLYAIKLACDRLHDGTADVMLAGAVNCADDLFIHLGFAALRALSRSGQSRPFHRDADGLVPAEGCAFVALRRLDDAVRDGDTIHGIIRGVGLSNDGRGRGMLVPSSDGQTRAMAGALAMSGLAPTDISLLECHATGTQVGDATEIHSAAAVYGERVGLPIGSLKSNTGHLIATAGVAGLIKVLEAMRHEVRPPTLHVDEPLDAVGESPFRLLEHAEPWDRTEVADGVLRAGVSAFGFGGNNAHLIVEEPRAAAALVGRAEPTTARPVPLAIVGIGIVAASAVGTSAFTEALLARRSCLDDSGMGRMPDLALALKQQKFPPNDLKAALAQQLAVLQVADEALADAGPTAGTSGVYVGMGTDAQVARYGARWRMAAFGRDAGATPDWLAAARDAIGPPLDAAGVLGTMPNIVANRLNSQYDITGPSFTVSAEEHSGLVALDLAARALRSGEIDRALVGAVDVSCEAVHIAASGLVLPDDRRTPGDAAVMLVVERLADAERDGHSVYAMLPGGRFDALGATLDDRPDLELDLGMGVGPDEVTQLFGHAHAASALVHVAAAAVALHHRVTPGDLPLLASNDGAGTGLAEGAGPRTARVQVAAMDGIAARSVLLAEASRHPAPSRTTAPRLHVHSGAMVADLLDALDARRESDDGPARLVIVADSDEQFAERAERARRHLLDGHPAGDGVHVRTAPVIGGLAFVFTGAGAATHAVGASLLRALPELTDASSSAFPLREVGGWIFDPGHEPSPSDYLWGTALLTQAHVHLTRHVLRLRPTAAIGYSSGESNSLYAFGVWTDMDAMRREIDASGMMEHELGGEFAAVARAWGVDRVRWAMWNVLAPVDEVRRVIDDEPRVHLAIIDTATDVVIGGDADACDRVVDRIGRRRCVPLGYNLACHVPEVGVAFHEPWVRVHTRHVTPAPGVRHYSNGVGGAYTVGEQACADAITRQAERTLDFPATIAAAYDDGVRVFVEHGPGGACTSFVREILRDRDVVAVQLDRRDKSLSQVFEAVAALVAAGVHVDHAALSDRLEVRDTPVRAADGPMLVVPAHPAPVAVPSLVARPATTHRPPTQGHVQLMEPAPYLPPVLPTPTPTPLAIVADVADPSSDIAAVIHQQITALAEMHQAFVTQQAAVHEQFLATRLAAIDLLSATTARPVVPPAVEVVMPPAAPPRPGHDNLATTTARPVVPPAAEAVMLPAAPPRSGHDNLAGAAGRPGPRWDKAQLEIHSSGRISELFGPAFAAQDEFAVQCRMPEPPLLLADRVTGLDAAPGVLGTGTIWTETDVVRDAWYLNGGHMPAGFMIESGQADLMLISWMGIDLLNLGTRAYRLLGCTLTYHGDLPAPGETLEYEIRITGHARHGDIRIFFFEYDCTVDGVPRLTVRDAQAGFFDQQELADALGVLWTPELGRADLSDTARVDPPVAACTKRSFSAAEVTAFSEGRVFECFGSGFEWTETHTRTPKIQAGAQLFIDEITEFDPTGGPWGRGFMRCETAIADDAWFFAGHFKNDPCMPGNFMVEACMEALSFYLAALGHTVRHDGWRFQPVPELPFELKCRGEINPRTERVAYELYVEEVWAGPHPTVICDVIGFVDGKAAFHAHRIGVELVPGWPLTTMPELYEGVVEPVAVATDRNGFPFDRKAMISCAWGKPSEAFGELYEVFDGPRRSPRLPGEPYHFMSRVTEIDGELGDCRAGMVITCEYDVPEDAWYFDENGNDTMPFAVLLEAALQPCGWVASAVGSASSVDDDLLFRNLDGTATLTGEVGRTAGTLRTRVELTRLSKAGGMVIENFDVVCSIGDRVVLTMQTVFGFFPPEAFANQVGLTADGNHRALLELRAGPMIDLTARSADCFDGELRLAGPRLLMVDRATVVPGAGAAGLGVVIGQKPVDVSAWFFKAHFFQDPVQPGSLGVEALLQLLQFFVIDTGMADGVDSPRFEPLMVDRPFTWKYRGQVTPDSTSITTVMEITEVGHDDRGPFVVGTGSLWCDGLRIYELAGVGMRVVSRTSRPDAAALAVGDVTEAMRAYWGPHRGSPAGWLGDDLMAALTETYVRHVMVPAQGGLAGVHGRSAIYVANHQVQIESVLLTQILPALTGVPITSVANAKHERRWIGELVDALGSCPGIRSEPTIAYFDQSRPESFLDIVADVRARMTTGALSFFVHVDGTRARSSRTRTERCSSVLIDLAIEMDVPIVPVRFTGGLPVDPIEGKAEVPVGHGRQDHWIGAPIEAAELRGLTLRERVDRVVGAINDLGVSHADDVPAPGDPEFAARVAARARRSGVDEVFAAAWEAVDRHAGAHPGADVSALRDAERNGVSPDQGSTNGAWLARMARMLFGAPPLSLPSVGLASHPHLVDHAIDGMPVVPVVHALEWFARAAAAHEPTMQLLALTDVQVLKGVTFASSDAPVELAVAVRASRPTDDGVVHDLVLTARSTGRVHYRCSAVLGRSESAPPVVSPPPSSAERWTTPLYGGVLFHGPAFQVIRSVDAVSDAGLMATVDGVIGRNWPDEPWTTDPAMLDGGLQLALLWTERLLGGPSLPTAVGELRVTGRPGPGPFTATLTGRGATSTKVTCDVVFRDAAGEPVGALHGIETHLLPPAQR